jgi:hypothetical protein
MTVELAAAGVLCIFWIAWSLERIVTALRRILGEMGTARWERGHRESLAREALDKLASGLAEKRDRGGAA